MDENELIARSQKKDVAAFNVLVERYQQLAYNVALRMLGDVQSAEDATQEAFVSAFEHVKQFRGGSFRSWLLRIVSNACLDMLRSRKRRASVPLDDLPADWDCSPLVADPDTPEEFVLRRELSAQIQRALLELPPDQRAAVILCDLQGLSYDEIAIITASSLGTVKSRISRGRARLRDVLLRDRELLAPSQRLINEGQET
ncbi:MAG: sigma-70 family RNA polymerase sigma factor [Chloroflexota bacterium]|nr:MAG: sigma-70 family RNA polymerase sigma factor [Chloroflexota bacterium]